MFRRPIKEINAEFQAEEKHLESIQQIVREASAAAGLSRKQVNAIQLAIEEGATNIIRHAYLYEKGAIRLRIITYRKLIVFSLLDTGRSFQPDKRGTLNLERLVETGRKGGLGFYMVQKIMDSVEYISTSRNNELRMIKRIDQDSEKTPPFIRRLFGLRVKFSFWTFFIVSLIIATVYYYLNSNSEKQFHANLSDTASALAATISDQAAGYIINKRSDVEFDRLVYSYKNANDFLKFITITDTSKIILADSDDIRNIRKQFIKPDYEEILLQRNEISVNEKNLQYVEVPILSGGRLLGSIHMVYSSEQLLADLQEAWRGTLNLTVSLLAIGIIGIFLLSSYFVTPIIKITRRVRRFSSGDLETEMPLEGADEFFEISHALNDMMARLSRDRETIIERERMAKEIEVASEIQKTLLPVNLPEIKGLEIKAFYRAASMIGGDLYDLFKIDDNKYCVVVADVSGKGVPASLVMSMLRTVIQIHAKNSSSSKEILVSVNNYLKDNIPPGMFITVLLAVINTEDNHVNVVSAGHNPLLYYMDKEKKLAAINPPGMPLGVPVTLEHTFEDKLKEIELNLEENDLLIFYTDGITEATNKSGEQFGKQRLNDVIIENMNSSAEKKLEIIYNNIINSVDSFTGSEKQSDDITYLLIKANNLTALNSDDPNKSSKIDQIDI